VKVRGSEREKDSAMEAVADSGTVKVKGSATATVTDLGTETGSAKAPRAVQMPKATG
jgi:hypothetical protein